MFSCGKRNQKTGGDTLLMNDNLESHYIIGKLIGSGCSGGVRECIDLQTQQLRACKTIFKRDRCLSWSDVYEDAKLEIEIMHDASPHPHIVELYETFEDERGIHLVMELCEGGDLFDEIKKSCFSEWLAAYIFRQIVDAVSHCHSIGIMHRDLKPENVFLTKRLSRKVHKRRSSLDSNFASGDKSFTSPSPLPHVKLGDFGLAVRVDSRGYSPAYGFAGSPFYAAPEVIQGELYGLPADIWSLGVVLYTLLAGNLPFAGETDQETFRQVCRGKPSFSSSAWHLVSSEAKILIRQMLSLDPRCRPSALQILHHPWLQAMSLNLVPSISEPQKSSSPVLVSHPPSPPVKKGSAKNDRFHDAPSTPGGSCFPLPVRRTMDEAGSKPDLPIPQRRNNPFTSRTPPLMRNLFPSPFPSTPPPPSSDSVPPCPSPLSLSPLSSANFPSNPSAFDALVSSTDQCPSPSVPEFVLSAASPPTSPYSSPSPYPSPVSMFSSNLHSKLEDDIPFLTLKSNCKDYVLAEDGCILFTPNRPLTPEPDLNTSSPNPKPQLAKHVPSKPNMSSFSPSATLITHLSESMEEAKGVEVQDKNELKEMEMKKRIREFARLESRVKVLSGKEGFNDWKFDIACFLQSLPWSCLQERAKSVPRSDSSSLSNQSRRG